MEKQKKRLFGILEWMKSDMYTDISFGDLSSTVQNYRRLHHC